jgi:FixJ family two-component response regulator
MHNNTHDSPILCIVDGNKQVRDSVGKSLSHRGFSDVEAYSTAEDLIEYLECKKQMGTELNCIVLTEYVLQGMNGIKLCKKIKDKFPSICVILFTGYYTDSTVTNSADHVIFKPVELPDLEEAIISTYVDKIVSGIERAC